MNNFRYRLAQFFSGRTGVDALGKTSSWAAVILMIITMITGWAIPYFIAIICLIYSIWRMFSKNYQKRYYENQKFLNATAGIRRFFSAIPSKVKRAVSKAKYDRQQKKIYKIFYCPSCKQKLRAPKGRGKILVTCSSCKTEFIKRV